MKSLVWTGVGILGLVALLAALLLPGLFQTTGCSNDRNAAATLKSLVAAQREFRDRDVDGDGVPNYWRADVAALYGMVPKGATDMTKFIDLSAACADFAPLPAPKKAGFEIRLPGEYGVRSAKVGYWYLALPFDGEEPGKLSPDRFAVCAVPDSFSAGRAVLVITQDGVVWSSPVRGLRDFPRAFPYKPEKYGWKRFER